MEECGGEEGSGGGEGVRVRRLVFMATPHLAQTEMRTRAGKYIPTCTCTCTCTRTCIWSLPRLSVCTYMYMHIVLGSGNL